MDLAGYYKSCWAFARAGELEAGERLIGFLERRFLKESGDLIPSPDLVRSQIGVYQNLAWYYMNGWVCGGAWLLGHRETALRIAADLARNQDPKTGGVFRMHNGETGCGDIGSTCSALNAFLTCGQIDNAKRAAEFLIHMLDAQPEPNMLYLAWSVEDGKLVTDDHPKAALTAGPLAAKHEVNSRLLGQEYWAPGMSIGTLGKLYLATHDERYLRTARGYFEFIKRCREDVKSTLGSGKLGWGCAVLHAITGEAEYADFPLAIAEFLLRKQLDAGTWLFEAAFKKLDEQPYPVSLDLGSEMAIWLIEYRNELLNGK